MGIYHYYVIVNCKRWGIAVLMTDGSIFVYYMRMKKISSVIVGLLLVITAFSQTELAMPAIPSMRVLHHESIVNSLNAITKLNRKSDNVLPVTKNDTLNRSINTSVRTLVNNMRATVELNSSLDDNAKFKWLRGINEMLTAFISGYNARTIAPTLLPALVKAYDDAMKAELAGTSIAPVIADNEISIGNVLVENYALKENKGISKAKDILVLKACQREPGNCLKILTRYPNNSYADSLIIQAAFNDQDELYNFASVPNALGRKIQSINHPLVKIIARLAAMKTGRMYFPFIDDLYHNKIKIDSITPFVLRDSSGDYYKLLVKTRISYAQRMQLGDTPMAAQVLTNKLQAKAIEIYINEINALHDEQNLNVRFRKLEGLKPQELYYLAVLGEEEIYTSSFVSGVYPRIFQKMRTAKSDTLFALVHNDYYKKFVKMCAAYNTLDNFLDKMEKSTAEKLMQSFVHGLEKTKSLEDAVDVADSYASIYNPNIRKLILAEVQQDLKENEQRRDKRGQIIYNLLNTIFLSMDSPEKVDVSANLGINPIYYMPNKLLKDTSGRIVMQQFFYGDKDGMNVFNAFISRFRNANWKIVKKPNWVEVSSVKGTPVTIYANLPLDEKKDLDTQAQDSLISYLGDKGVEPSIVIHRGHSYYLKSTISKLAPSAKVILLGSCGGYQMLNDVLTICPTAHIISSKQVGTGIINQGLINVISETLRQGKDLNWPAIWDNLEVKFSGSSKEKFDDYVPPYKNLGAIFIMAYNNKAQE